MAISAKRLFKEWEKDPEYVREYEALEDEFAQAKQLVEARSASGLTQAQVAKRMKTNQTTVARLESGRHKPSLATLEKYAEAVGRKVQIRLVPISEPRRAVGRPRRKGGSAAAPDRREVRS